MKKVSKISITIIMTILLNLCFTVTVKAAESYDDMIKAFQEVAYAYYMRGTSIQYNSKKGLTCRYSPEEATSQNINYITCSAFTNNVYKELLGIKLPVESSNLIKYTRENVGNPEVVAYGHTDIDGNLKMQFYDAEEKTNPTLQEMMQYMQIRRSYYIYWTCSSCI